MDITMTRGFSYGLKVLGNWLLSCKGVRVMVSQSYDKGWEQSGHTT